MNEQLIYLWHNYRTGEKDSLTEAPTEDNVKDYLPWLDENTPTGFYLYQVLRKQGKEHLEAMQLVLTTSLGE